MKFKIVGRRNIVHISNQRELVGGTSINDEVYDSGYVYTSVDQAMRFAEINTTKRPEGFEHDPTQFSFTGPLSVLDESGKVVGTFKPDENQ